MHQTFYGPQGPVEPLTIAIQPDDHYRGQEAGSFSDRWIQRAPSAGVDVRVVDVWSPDIVDQIRGAQGFMWRYMNRVRERRLGKMLCPAVELGLGIPTYPSWKTGRYYEDKLAQKYALEAAGIPIPPTWVFYDDETALSFSRVATYPLVMKLATGVMSMSVVLIESRAEAEYWIREMFGPGTATLDRPATPAADRWRRIKEGSRLARGKVSHRRVAWAGLQHGYILFQEFLPGNEFDTRVTVVGNRAWGFRRFNRPGDFRSSGSGLIDYDPSGIDEAVVRLGFTVARQLGTQSLTVDGLVRGSEPVLGEISYSYQSHAVSQCPGHWVLEGPPKDGRLRWVRGPSFSEDAIFDDFVSLARSQAQPSPIQLG